jgi:transcription elongation factor Elf1
VSGRGVPFHCPYCGDEDLRPHETDEGSGHGAWECRSCLRAFHLKMLGMITPRSTGPESSEVPR